MISSSGELQFILCTQTSEEAEPRFFCDIQSIKCNPCEEDPLIIHIDNNDLIRVIARSDALLQCLIENGTSLENMNAFAKEISTDQKNIFLLRSNTFLGIKRKNTDKVIKYFDVNEGFFKINKTLITCGQPLVVFYELLDFHDDFNQIIDIINLVNSSNKSYDYRLFDWKDMTSREILTLCTLHDSEKPEPFQAERNDNKNRGEHSVYLDKADMVMDYTVLRKLSWILLRSPCLCKIPIAAIYIQKFIEADIEKISIKADRATKFLQDLIQISNFHPITIELEVNNQLLTVP